MKISEGDRECHDDDEDECFEARKRRRVKKGQSGKYKTYKMELEADDLTELDVREPMVLVKEYRRTKGRRRENRFQIYYVPRSSDGLDFGGGASGGVECGDDVCYVNGRMIEVGDRYDDDDLCIRYDCVAPGSIETDETCDRSK